MIEDASISCKNRAKQHKTLFAGMVADNSWASHGVFYLFVDGEAYYLSREQTEQLIRNAQTTLEEAAKPRIPDVADVDRITAKGASSGFPFVFEKQSNGMFVCVTGKEWAIGVDATFEQINGNEIFALKDRKYFKKTSTHTELPCV